MKTFILIFFTFFFVSTAHSQTVTVDKNPKNSFTSSTLYNDDIQTIWGTGSDFACEYDTAQTPDAMVCWVSADSNNLIIGSHADIGEDFAHEESNDPTLFIQRDNSWVSLGVVDSGGEIRTSGGFLGLYGSDIQIGTNYVINVDSTTPGSSSLYGANFNPPGDSYFAGTASPYQIVHIDGGFNSGTQSQEFTGINSRIEVASAAVQSGTSGNSMRAGLFEVYQNSSGTVAQMEAINAQALSVESTGTKGLVTTQRGVLVTTGYGASASGSGSITTSTGVSVKTPQSTAAGRTITDYYGLKIENAEATGVTNAYSIATGTGRVQLGGNVEFSNGKAMTASLYQIGRDADGTNQLHFNVPTGATMEWSVNDVAVMTLTGSNMSMNNQPIQNIGNSGTDFGGSGQLTVGNAATSGGTTALTVVMGAHTAVSTNTPAISLTAYTNTLNSGSSLANSSGVELQAPTYNGVAGGAAETITDAATLRVVGPAVAGSNITVTNAYAMLIDAGDSRFDGFIISNPQTVSIADNGGGTPAASTVTPSSNDIQITCNDANGCDITMSETGQKNGATIRLVNVSANTINFADTSGVTEIAGAYAAGQYDSITMTYQSDRWIEDGRSNN